MMMEDAGAVADNADEEDEGGMAGRMEEECSDAPRRASRFAMVVEAAEVRIMVASILLAATAVRVDGVSAKIKCSFCTTSYERPSAQVTYKYVQPFPTYRQKDMAGRGGAGRSSPTTNPNPRSEQ